MSYGGGSYPKRRRNFLYRAMIAGDLNCQYCGQTDLIIRHNQDPEIPMHRRATIDHIIPVSKGGSTKQTNWAISCERCNKKKGARIW
jgi:5-methylcytosine-specific restriction endonuclease McrA